MVATFFMPSNCALLRWGIRTETGNNTSVLEIDDVQISSDIFETAQLSNDTNWESYTLTIGSTGTAPTPGTVSINQATFRRDGSDAIINYTFKQTSSGGASSGTGTYLFPIPPGS